MMMKHRLFTAIMLGALSLPAYAEFVDTPPASTQPVQVQTVREARHLPDDSHVVLEGTITGRAGTPNPEEFFFKDETDSIKVEINPDVWRGQTVTPKTRVRIWGEIDQNRWNQTVEIEAKRLEIVPVAGQ